MRATAGQADRGQAVTGAEARRPPRTCTRPVAAGAAEPHPDPEQIKNARAIIEAGQKMHLPARAWVIAIATSMQESQLKNIGDLGDANDHDSLGLFQQRPSSGWGTPEQLPGPRPTPPPRSTRAWSTSRAGTSMPLTDAAQAVQVSAFPDHYAKWENGRRRPGQRLLRHRPLRHRRRHRK